MPYHDPTIPKDWIHTYYPVGRRVEVTFNEGPRQAIVTNHYTYFGVLAGIILQYEDTGSYNEVGTEFLDEEGNGKFVHEQGWQQPEQEKKQ